MVSMRQIHPDFLLESYLYELPEDRIAQWPVADRSASRLMVLRRGKDRREIAAFSDILAYLPENCLLVANNSRVVPARLAGQRRGGGKTEFLLLTPLPLLKPGQQGDNQLFPGWQRTEAEVLCKPAKKVTEGEIISFGMDLAVEVLERGEFGRFKVNLVWQGDLLSKLEQFGAPPLPPYIKRVPLLDKGQPQEPRARSVDMERYQTIYARRDKSGSVAAPTAGLHFTPELCRAIEQSGREWAELTLYVGYGTFSPVRSEDIREHAMHAEYVEMSEESARAIARAKAEGRAVIAVGTTSCRALEGIGAMRGNTARPDPFAGWVNHFLYPGKPFNIIDGMITNFHLPGSSLLMLVSALAGRERILAAYKEAVERDFRFFSYGDAMLIV